MKDISKSFPGVQALSGVSYELQKGEVHALMGENGAGKSTLMKILTGAYKEDTGEIIFDGAPFMKRDERTTLSAGIAMIHQELSFVPYLTIAENLFLGREIMKSGVLDKRRMNELAGEWLKNLGVDLDPKRKMNSLMVSEQQMVEITKAVSYNAKIIIMDEPTSAITDREVEKLFGTIRDLKAKGVAIVYISHKMDEILQISDRVTVFRDGELISTNDAKDITMDQIVIDMVGRELTEVYPEKEHNLGEEMLRVEGLKREGVFNDISFTVHRGEVVGFAGLMGSGRTETMRCIYGLDKLDAGKIFIQGKEVAIKHPRDAIKYGIGLVNEDRKGVGLLLPLSVKHNLTLSNLDKYFKSPIIQRAKENELAERMIKELRIKTPSRNQLVNNLSGGNQQKVVLGKILLDESDILIMDEPTRGIDIGAKSEIYHMINDLAKSGKAVIVVSSEMPEIVGLADKVIVMHEGAIKGEITDPNEIQQEKIMEFAIAQ
ncbi:sugar ABC transporter ATP-binding protein [Christensenellaceae bacterium OttesenSCG-928-K19]|nr:sugar ABC transporter ATP-binding protein [Christensenellaceae bacterium OttesenSCG-928-K19]